jgi:hypothetical protein
MADQRDFDRFAFRLVAIGSSWLLVLLLLFLFGLLVSLSRVEEKISLNALGPQEQSQTCFDTAADPEAPYVHMGLRGVPPDRTCNTPATYLARIAWGRAALLYLATSLLAISVLLIEGANKHRAAWTVPYWIALAVIVIAAFIIPNTITTGGSEDLVSRALANLRIDDFLATSSLAPGIVLGLVLLLLGTRTIINVSAREVTEDSVRQHGLGWRRATYACAAALVGSVIYSNALHALPVALLPANDDAQKAVVERVKLIATNYSIAQGTIWTLFLFAIYAPVAFALDRRADALCRKALSSTGEDVDATTAFLALLRGRKVCISVSGTTVPLGVDFNADGAAVKGMLPIERLIAAVLGLLRLGDEPHKGQAPHMGGGRGVRLPKNVTEMSFELDGNEFCAMKALAPSPTYKDRKDWLEKHGLDKTAGQQLTTLAAVLAPFVSGTALIELIDAFGR